MNLGNKAAGGILSYLTGDLLTVDFFDVEGLVLVTFFGNAGLGDTF